MPLIVEPVVESVEPAVQPVIDATAPVITPVAATVTPLTDPIVGVVSPVVDPIVGPIDPVDPIILPMQDVTHPVFPPILDSVGPLVPNLPCVIVLPPPAHSAVVNQVPTPIARTPVDSGVIAPVSRAALIENDYVYRKLSRYSVPLGIARHVTHHPCDFVRGINGAAPLRPAAD